MTKSSIKKRFENYWYYAGQWHNAECYFILHDQGVCNCKPRKNSMYLNEGISKEIDKAVKEERERILEVVRKHDDTRDTKLYKAVLGLLLPKQDK